MSCVGIVSFLAVVAAGRPTHVLHQPKLFVRKGVDVVVEYGSFVTVVRDIRRTIQPHSRRS